MKFDPTKLVQLRRPNFFDGSQVTAADMRAEQTYQREKQWLHNRMLHGYGIVVGLEVGLAENEDGGTQLIVSPGYGLDGWGRELVVQEPFHVYLPGDRHDLTIYLKYSEQVDEDGKSPTPQRVAESSGPATAEHTVERPHVSFEPTGGEVAVTPPTRSDFAIALARVRRPHAQWQRDRNFRPPRAK